MTIKRKKSLRTTSFLIFCALICGLLLSSAPAAPCPIKRQTTKISYHHHTNSGMAIYTTVKLYPDYLVWEYNEARNDCRLKDSCRYNKKDFEILVMKLSEIEFSATDLHDHRVGGAGYSYSFVVNGECYLYFDNLYQFSGNYQTVQDLIQQFIKSHPTPCELLFKKLSKEPHERGPFGEFSELPQELERYQVR